MRGTPLHSTRCRIDSQHQPNVISNDCLWVWFDFSRSNCLVLLGKILANERQGKRVRLEVIDQAYNLCRNSRLLAGVSVAIAEAEGSLESLLVLITVIVGAPVHGLAQHGPIEDLPDPRQPWFFSPGK